MFCVGTITHVAVAVPPTPSVGPEKLIARGSLSMWLSETALVVSPYSTSHATEILIGWNKRNGVLPLGLGCATSIDNGSTFVQQPFSPSAPCAPFVVGVDPMAAISPSSGDMWFGGLIGKTFQISRKAYGSMTLDPSFSTIINECTRNPDKGFLALGPRPPGRLGSSEVMYLNYMTTPTSSSTGAFASVGSIDAAPPIGQAWGPTYPITSDAGSTPRNGNDSYPVVIQSGPNTGRLVVASSNDVRTVPPEVSTSDSGGDPTAGGWSGYTSLDSFGFPLTSPIFGVGLPSPVPGAINATTFASVAVDPALNSLGKSTIYIIFTGRLMTLVRPARI